MGSGWTRCTRYRAIPPNTPSPRPYAGVHCAASSDREKALEPCVYILASARNGTFYTGVTSNLIARIYQHREGVTGGFTSEHQVWRLVHYEMHESMPAAIRREKSIKRWKREYKLNLIERDNPDWQDLAIGLGFGPLPKAPPG